MLRYNSDVICSKAQEDFAMPDPDFKSVPLESVDQPMDPGQLDELRGLLAAQPRPVPSEALALLQETAAGDTGGSVAARTFLFWLVGRPDPTGLGTDGALELRRLDEDLARRFPALEAAQNDR